MLPRMRGGHSGRPSVRQSAHPRPLDQRDNWRPEEYSGPAENVAYLGAGKKRTHCRGNIAHVIMFPKCCLVLPRAQHLWRTQILCPGHKKMFLEIFRNISCVREVRNNVSSFCRDLTLHTDLVADVRLSVRLSVRPSIYPFVLSFSHSSMHKIFVHYGVSERVIVKVGVRASDSVSECVSE